MGTIKRFNFIILALFLSLAVSCSDNNNEIDLNNISAPSTSEDDSEGDEQVSNLIQTIVISSGDTNNGGFFAYNTDGSYIKSFINLRTFDLSTPTAAQGVARSSSSSFITSLNGSDALLEIQSNSNQNTDDFDIFYGSSSLNGNIYDIEYSESTGIYYVVESNNIEAFDENGTRISAARINQNLGACSLNNPRNLEVSGDFLYVASLSNNSIVKYDISAITPVCDTSYSLGVNIYGLTKHSNGLVYFTSFSADAVYTLDEDTSTVTEVFNPGTTILNEPRAIVEVEDGNLLVSSALTDSIEKIDSSGARIGLSPFIVDSHSLNVTDIEVIELEL